MLWRMFNNVVGYKKYCGVIPFSTVKDTINTVKDFQYCWEDIISTMKG